MVTRCEEEQTDVLLIAGDLFHRQPLLRDLKEVNYLFSTLSHTKVVLIAGDVYKRQIYNNAAKYAMPGTRVYADLWVTEENVGFSLKNISEQPLNISADELTERFIRRCV